MIQLPIKLGGLGIPSLADTSPPAFLASLCLAMPALRETLRPAGAYMTSLTQTHADILSGNRGGSHVTSVGRCVTREDVAQDGQLECWREAQEEEEEDLQ